MKNCIKFGILEIIIALLSTVMPDHDISTIQIQQSNFIPRQSYVISQAKSYHEAANLHISKIKLLCENADLSYIKDNKLKHLYPTLLNVKAVSPKKKFALYANIKTFPVPSHPVEYYIFGLRKIVI